MFRFYLRFNLGIYLFRVCFVFSLHHPVNFFPARSLWTVFWIDDQLLVFFHMLLSLTFFRAFPFRVLTNLVFLIHNQITFPAFNGIDYSVLFYAFLFCFRFTPDLQTRRVRWMCEKMCAHLGHSHTSCPYSSSTRFTRLAALFPVQPLRTRAPLLKIIAIALKMLFSCCFRAINSTFNQHYRHLGGRIAATAQYSNANCFDQIISFSTTGSSRTISLRCLNKPHFCRARLLFPRHPGGFVSLLICVLRRSQSLTVQSMGMSCRHSFTAFGSQ